MKHTKSEEKTIKIAIIDKKQSKALTNTLDRLLEKAKRAADKRK